MTSPGQLGLIRRHPSMTRAQFSDYWLHHHGPLGIPWALANGCILYAQTHNLRPGPVAPPADLNIDEWDGAAELVFASPPGTGMTPSQAAKSADFFRRVIVPDEKKFLVDEARKQVRFVDAGVVEGDRVVLVEDGKVVVGEDGRPVVDVAEATRVWEEWVVGEQEEEKEGK